MAKDKTDKLISDTFHRLGNGLQFNIMDIPKMFKEAREGIASGLTVEDAMKVVIERYRRN